MRWLVMLLMYCGLFIFSNNGFADNKKENITVVADSTLAPVIEPITQAFKMIYPQYSVSFHLEASNADQISNNPSFDVFLAADEESALLTFNLLTIPIVKPKYYATGKLAMISTNPIKERVDIGISNARNIDTVITNLAKTEKIIILDPKLSPYGMLSLKFLAKLDSFERLKINNQLVYNEAAKDIINLLLKGKASITFTSTSVWYLVNLEDRNKHLYFTEIDVPFLMDQFAVLLNNKKSSQDFYDFLSHEIARKIFRDHSYITY